MTLQTGNSGAGVVEKVTKARASFRSGRTRSISWRRSQLEALKRLVKKEGLQSSRRSGRISASPGSKATSPRLAS
jgi:hypothetical protein